MPRQNAAENPYAAASSQFDIVTGTTAPQAGSRSGNPYAATSNPYAAAPDVTGLDIPTGEGQYWMTNKYGGRLHVPYSKVRQAAQAGFTMNTEDRDQFMTDARADKKVGRLFPDLRLPEGVRIVGMNPAGQPMFGTTGTAPKGSAAQRFLSSAGEQIAAPITGTARAIWEGPQTPEEAATQARVGPVGMRVERMLINPSLDQFRQAKEEFRQSGSWLDPTPEQARHQSLAVGHTLGMLPLIGPAAATIGEKMGQQAGTGDYAGAAGTLTGAAALETAPKLGTKVGKFVTERMPRHAVARVIRPMKRDVEFGKDPVQAILDQGITGTSLESMGRKVATKLKTVGAEIDKVVADPKYAHTKVDVSKSLAPLDHAIREAGQAGDTALFDRLVATREQLTSNYKPFRNAQGEVVLRRVGPKNMMMAPTEVLAYKRTVGSRIRWSQDALDEPVNGALGGVYSSVKDSLNRAVPDLKPLNKSYADLVAAKSAIERRAPIAERQSYVDLFDVALGVTHSWPLLIAKKAAQFPIVKTGVARGAYSLRHAVPERMRLPVSAPAVGVLQSQQNRQRTKSLRELREEAERHRP